MKYGLKRSRSDDGWPDLPINAETGLLGDRVLRYGVRDPASTQVPRPSLGVLLVESRLASELEVKEALVEGLRTGERLGEVFVRKGRVTDGALAELLAEQWQLPFVSADSLVVDRTAMRRMPLGSARELGAVPIGFDLHGIVVALAEPGPGLFAAVVERVGEASFVVVARSILESLLASRELLDGEGGDTETSRASEAGDHTPAPEADELDEQERGDVSQPAPERGGAGLEAALAAIDGVVDGLLRAREELAALGRSLGDAQEQIALRDARLEAEAQARKQDAKLIRRLEGELAQHGDLFTILKQQVAKLTETFDSSSPEE